MLLQFKHCVFPFVTYYNGNYLYLIHVFHSVKSEIVNILYVYDGALGRRWLPCDEWHSRTPSLEMAHVCISVKIKCTLLYIAIHQAIQYHQHYSPI